MHPGLSAPGEEALHMIWRIIKLLSRGHFSHETSIEIIFTREKNFTAVEGPP